MLPDGWEVLYSQLALERGLVDNLSIASSGARGVMDPSMEDSDLDGIPDGQEDPDRDGLNRSGLVKKYCPGYEDPPTASVTSTPTPPMAFVSTTTWRITRISRNSKTARIRSRTTPTVTNGTTDRRSTTRTTTTTGWQRAGNTTSNSTLTTQQTAWWTPTVTATSTIVNTSGTRTQGTPCRSPVRVNCATRSLSEQAAS